MTTAASFNRELGLKINRDIWNGRQFDKIVIMTVQDGKVVHQAGVIDNLTGLRQVGVMPVVPA
ncbi:MAG: hypothetical protein IT513_18410 [Burkholderiales bacterium]|nr:hypothetical protein [Burkholderiales bacterium]